MAAKVYDTNHETCLCHSPPKSQLFLLVSPISMHNDRRPPRICTGPGMPKPTPGIDRSTTPPRAVLLVRVPPAVSSAWPARACWNTSSDRA